MENPRVFNKGLDNYPAGCVYIGRFSKWHSELTVGKDGSSEEVRQKFKSRIENNAELVQAAKTELKGKNLLCFCSHEDCHGDVWIEVANS